MLLDTTICKYRHCNIVIFLPIKLWKPPSTVVYFNKIAERPKTSLKLILSLFDEICLMKVGHRVTYLQWFCQHLSWKNCFSGRKAFFSKDQSTFHPQVLSHTGRITLCHLDKSKTLIAQDQLFLLLRTLGWIGVFIHLNLFKGPQCVFWHWKPCCWTLFFKYTLKNKISEHCYLGFLNYVRGKSPF